eukprot:m.10674 g.10674  ORF g.10674 m.10674 type:complete len:1156 (+) comp4303_c1_seq1:107-3574(+)
MRRSHLAACVAFGVVLQVAAQFTSTCLPTFDVKKCNSASDDQPVCDPVTGITYKAPACARCNNVSDFSPGECSEATKDITVLASCDTPDCVDPAFPEVVCYGKKNYYSPACAKCDGAKSPSDLRFGVCGLTANVKTSCSASATAEEEAACESDAFNAAAYVCADGVTYRTKECAKCNGKSTADMSAGPCRSDSPQFHPCVNTRCGDNAQCTLTEAHCAFENGHTCGWISKKPNFANPKETVDAGFDLVQNGGQGVPVDARVESEGTGFMLASEDLRPEMYSSPPSQIDNGETCRLSFFMAGTAGVGVELRYRNEDEVNGTFNVLKDDDDEFVRLNIDRAYADVWEAYEFNLKGMTGRYTFKLMGYLATDDYMAIDDIALECNLQDEDRDAGFLSYCKCDPGYGPVEDSCMPKYMSAIKSEPRLRQLNEMLKSSLMNFRIEGLDKRQAFLAPTDDAFETLDNTNKELFLSLRKQSSPEAFRFLSTHLMATDYQSSDLASVGRVLVTSGSEHLDVVRVNVIGHNDKPNFTASVIDTIDTADGVLFLIDNFLVEGRRPSFSDFCKQCGANAECDQVRQTTGCAGGCYKLVDGCSCPNPDRESDVCANFDDGGTVRQIGFRSACLANCSGANITDYGGVCVRPKCLCKAGYLGDGYTCSEIDTTTTPVSTTAKETTASLGHRYFTRYFWVDGNYDRLIGGFDAMRESSFVNALMPALPVAENFTVVPERSARVPGYVLIRMFGDETGLAAMDLVLKAVAQGNVSFYYKHLDSASSNALPNTLFTAYPMFDLPPISRYVFYLDGEYRKNVCQPEPRFNRCREELNNQEHVVEQVRFGLQDEFGLDEAQARNLTYIWAYECQRRGLEGKIEIEVTAFSIHAEVLMQIRSFVETSNVFTVSMTRLRSDKVEVTMQARPIRFDTRPVDQPRLKAELSGYPGYHGERKVSGMVEIMHGASDGHISVDYEIFGLTPESSGGIHVHTGKSCRAADLVEGHFYKTAIDPWNDKIYEYKSYPDGLAIGSFSIDIGDVDDNELVNINGRAFVVHDVDGTRIGCGILSTVKMVEGAGDEFEPVTFPGSITAGVPGSSKESDEHDYKAETIAIVVVALLLVIIIVVFVMRSKKKGSSNISSGSAEEGVGPTFVNPLAGMPAPAPGATPAED